MKSVFITGTDTGVGKTFLATALLAAARARGIDAVPMKPVQTGCAIRDGRLVAPDLESCLSACGIPASPDDQRRMCPYRFQPACSPHLAAAERGEPISIPHIVDCFQSLQVRHGAVVVEGAGGILVPVSATETMLDIMRALSLPVVLAARPGLGTLNHTLLSLSMLRTAGLDVSCVVMVESTQNDWGRIEDDNRRVIGEFAHVEVARLPHSSPTARGPIPELDPALEQLISSSASRP